VTDDAISGLFNLTSLSLAENSVTGATIARFTALTTLDLSWNRKVDGHAISGLVNLTYLRLASNPLVGDQALSALTNLITPRGISCLTNLQTLTVLIVKSIGDNLRDFRSLTELHLSHNYSITNEGISGLTTLKTLSLIRNQALTNDGLRSLVNLNSVKISSSKDTLTIDCLTGCTSLTTLIPSGGTVLSDSVLLKTLFLDASGMKQQITGAGISCLTNLTYLNYCRGSWILRIR
jgi:hypothetical protein